MAEKTKTTFAQGQLRTIVERIERLEEELSDLLATQVQLKMGAKGRGQLIIDFANLDALDNVLEKLRR